MKEAASPSAVTQEDAVGVNVRSSVGLAEINKVCGMQVKLERTPVPPCPAPLLLVVFWSRGCRAAPFGPAPADVITLQGIIERLHLA